MALAFPRNVDAVPPPSHRLALRQQLADLLADIGEHATAAVIRLPTAADPTMGLGIDGGALVTLPVGGTPNDPSGPLCIGTDLLDGVPQAGSGSLAITAVYVARGRDDATVAALRQLARDHLAPVVAPIAVTALTGAPRTLDLAPYVTADPAGMGVAVTLGTLPAGLSASAAGTVVTYSSATEAVYSLPLTVTSLHGLAPSRTVTARLTLSSEATRWPNGYRWRARINLIPWNATGTISNFLLPFAEVLPEFRSVANGGHMESADGRDFRLETAAGVKIPHVLLAYDPTIGLVAGFGNIAARNIGVAEAGYAFVGKPGLSLSEEDAVGCRAGGWLFFGSGHSATDFSGQSRDWTTSVNVGQGRIGSWPAGVFDGATSYRARTSSEMNGLAGLTVIALVSSNEAVGRTQEFLNLAPADVADLALRLGSAGEWVGILDAGAQLQAVRSDAGLYYPGRGHAVALVWNSGSRPVMYVDGALIDPETPPAVATGTTAINEVLEIGRGNRPSGAATWWAGLIGPTLECSRGLARAEIECLGAALAEPRLVYGLGAFKEVTTAAVPPVAQPVEVSVAPGSTSAPIDVQAAAFNPDGLALTTTVGAPTGGSASVASDGRVLASMPAGTASQVHRVPYTLTSGLMSSSSVITVRVQPPVVVPEPGLGLPAGFPAVPTFSGAVINVSTRQQLQDAIDTAPSGDRRIRCAGGVDYGTITINNTNNPRLEIVCTTPPFTSLDTRQRSDLTLASVNDTNARSKVVVGAVAQSQTAGINLVPIRAGVIWLEGFYLRPGQRIVRQNTINCDVWVRKCRLGDSEGGLIRLGGTSSAIRNLIVWESWLWGDGSKPGEGRQAQANYTDYGLQIYNSTGVYVYKSFLEGGMSHMISCKLNVEKIMIYNTVFMPWTSIGYSGMVNLQLGQEGSTAGNDRTCGMATIRNNTWGSWSAQHNVGRHTLIDLQDGNGVIFENNMVYPNADYIVTARYNRNTGLTNNDEGLPAGGGGVLIRNNTILGASGQSTAGVLLSEPLYRGTWAGMTVTFENNSVPGAAIPIGAVDPDITVVLNSNPGFRR